MGVKEMIRGKGKATSALPPALDGGDQADLENLAKAEQEDGGMQPLRDGLDRLPPPDMEYAQLPELDVQGKERKDRQGNPLFVRKCTNYPAVLYALECPRGPENEELPNIRVVNTPEEYAAAEDDGFADLHVLVTDPKDPRGRSLMRDPTTAAAIHKKRKAILDKSRGPDAVPDATKTAAEKLVAALSGAIRS